LQEKAHIAKLPGSRTCENGLSSASIHDIWRAFALAPHRFETFELSKDQLLIEKVSEIVHFDARNSFTDFNGDGHSEGCGAFPSERVWRRHWRACQDSPFLRWRDKTFFFFGYEGWRYSQPQNGLYVVPTPAELNGDFSNPGFGANAAIFDPTTTTVNASGNGYTRQQFTNNTIPQDQIDTQIQTYIKILRPAEPASKSELQRDSQTATGGQLQQLPGPGQPDSHQEGHHLLPLVQLVRHQQCSGYEHGHQLERLRRLEYWRRHHACVQPETSLECERPPRKPCLHVREPVLHQFG